MHRVSINKDYGAIKYGSCLDVADADELRQKFIDAGAISISLAYQTFLGR